MSEQKFNWKAFQKIIKCSDEELEVLKSDPKRTPAAKKLFTPEIMKKDFIIEVIDSHGYSCRLKQGNRLVFYLKPWCNRIWSAVPRTGALMPLSPVPGMVNVV